MVTVATPVTSQIKSNRYVELLLMWGTSPSDIHKDAAELTVNSRADIHYVAARRGTRRTRRGEFISISFFLFFSLQKKNASPSLPPNQPPPLTCGRWSQQVARTERSDQGRNDDETKEERPHRKEESNGVFLFPPHRYVPHRPLPSSPSLPSFFSSLFPNNNNKKKLFVPSPGVEFIRLVVLAWAWCWCQIGRAMTRHPTGQYPARPA